MSFVCNASHKKIAYMYCLNQHVHTQVCAPLFFHSFVWDWFFFNHRVSYSIYFLINFFLTACFAPTALLRPTTRPTSLNTSTRPPCFWPSWSLPYRNFWCRDCWMSGWSRPRRPALQKLVFVTCWTINYFNFYFRLSRRFKKRNARIYEIDNI